MFKLQTEILSITIDINTFHSLYCISDVCSVWRSSIYTRHKSLKRERIRNMFGVPPKNLCSAAGQTKVTETHILKVSFGLWLECVALIGLKGVLCVLTRSRQKKEEIKKLS